MNKSTNIIVVVLLVFPITASALQNQLKNHASPYLAMHGDDPIAWQAWGAHVLKQAKRQNKLIFVSIGYFACHWCHVMQRESFSDTAIAKKLNKAFIPVKIDRELNPALDAYLIEFVQRTRGHAGWPLNVFLTPDGNPVVGMVYAPKQQFRTLLEQLDQMWSQDHKNMGKMAADAALQLKGKPLPNAAKLSQTFGREVLTGFLQTTMQVADDMSGGFGEQNKFPMIAQLDLLLSAYQRNSMPQIKAFIELTLNQMATQGLRDHIGGGFFRYTVDPNWQTPHFEKMLYDNAQLAMLYFKAGEILGRKDFLALGRETLNFMQRELMTPAGGLVASLSAVDAADIEGGYYLWDKPTLKKALNPSEYEAVNLLWQLENAAPFEAGYLPFYKVPPDEAAKQLRMQTSEFMQRLGSAQFKLLQLRNKRKLPVDTKQLAAWNGLALSAFVLGAQKFNSEKFTQAAKGIRDYIVKQLWNGQRLYRARTDAGEVGRVGLEDYAYAAEGLLRWAMLKNHPKDIELAQQWLHIAWQRYYSPTGWIRSDDMLLPYVLGEAVIQDNPMPSPSAVLLRTSLELAQLKNDKQLKLRAVNALGVGQKLLQQQPFYYATQVGMVWAYQAGLH